MKLINVKRKPFLVNNISNKSIPLGLWLLILWEHDDYDKHRRTYY